MSIVFLIFQIIKEILPSRINQVIDNPIHFRIFKFVDRMKRTVIEHSHE